MANTPKGKKFTLFNIRGVSGGRDPLHLVEEFILKHGYDPEKCRQHQSADNARWMVPLGDGQELELLVEGLKTPEETTVYMGLNAMTVPVRGSADLLATALQIADGLIGIKVSLVGHYLVLSASLGTAGLSVEDLDYHFSLITVQHSWFRDAVMDEMGWESLPEE